MMDAHALPLALSPAASDASTSSASAGDGPHATGVQVAPLVCDECEALSATLDCDDCGLVYCAGCDKSRHRKGKLVFHQRKRIELTPAKPMDVAQWTEDHVTEWLRDHELEVFLSEAAQHHMDGAFLVSAQMEAFLDSQSTASRGHKKKLQREIQKLKSDASGGGSASASPSPDRMFGGGFVANDAPSPMPPAAVMPSTERSSLKRMGVNLRVNVDAQRAPAPEKHFSPVASLRSRATHGQVDDLKGRVHRHKSILVLDDNASTPVVNVNKSVERRATPSLAMPPAPLQIDVSDNRSPPGLPPLEMPGAVPAPSQQRDLRSIRQALGGLDLDMMNVKKDGRAVEASFDFSAEGRLQTQGFDINTNGIANAPFPNQDAGRRKSSQYGTREYLVMLNELGHGASGKVFKALYLPTMKLVAVKVIRVYDQKKRHQMVRELKSLYFNLASIDDAQSRAACEELVIFYDAYTNPEIGSVSIVLEYMDGGSLEDYMQQLGKSCSEKDLANIAYCALKGLAFLHENHQLHRDIKLSNMLINRDGQVKISDFGISRDLESTLAKAMTFTGTLLYMAPERISGGMYSYPSDIWSFGLALMACAIGKLPVPTKEGYWGVVQAVQEQPSPKLSDYGDHFSPELCDFIDLCLRKNPMLRPRASQLLEHAFIKQNYEPGVRHSIDLSALHNNDSDQQHYEKRMQELEFLAKQVRSWYQDHAAKGSPLPSEDPLLRQIPFHDRVRSLARQLRLPLEIVAEKLQFIEAYHLSA